MHQLITSNSTVELQKNLRDNLYHSCIRSFIYFTRPAWYWSLYSSFCPKSQECHKKFTSDCCRNQTGDGAWNWCECHVLSTFINFIDCTPTPCRPCKINTWTYIIMIYIVSQKILELKSGIWGYELMHTVVYNILVLKSLSQYPHLGYSHIMTSWKFPEGLGKRKMKSSFYGKIQTRYDSIIVILYYLLHESIVSAMCAAMTRWPDARLITIIKIVEE